MNLSLFTAGTDPEFMLFDRKKGEIVSAIPVVPQNKETPVSLGKGFAFYHDNVMLEATVPPSNSNTEFVRTMRDLFTRIHAKLGDNYELRCTASHTFTEKDVDHDDARVAGCSPEFDAYAMEVCYPPDFIKGFRSAGGHLHLGRKDFEAHIDNADGVPLIDPYNKMDVIKLLDIFVGLPLMLIDKDPTSQARKTLYGKAGRHRPTPYGVEYRTPGNFWLSSPILTELIYDLTAYVSDINARGETEPTLARYEDNGVQEIIDSNNIEMASKLVYALELPGELYHRVHNAKDLKFKSFNAEWNVTA